MNPGNLQTTSTPEMYGERSPILAQKNRLTGLERLWLRMNVYMFMYFCRWVQRLAKRQPYMSMSSVVTGTPSTTIYHGVQGSWI